MADITIDGEIGFGLSDKTIFNETLKEFTGKDISVRIASAGGNLDHALSIHDLLKSHKGKVTAILDGIVASAATVIAMAADKIQMSENAFFMVHKVTSPVFLMAQMNEDDIDNMIDTLKDLQDIQQKMDLTIANIYSKATGRRAATMLNLMKDETWMTANEAKEAKFIDEVIDASMVNQSQILAMVAKANLKQLPNQNQFNMSDTNKSWFEGKFNDLMAKFQTKAEPAPNTPAAPPADPPKKEPVGNTITEKEFNSKIEEVMGKVVEQTKAFEAKAEEDKSAIEQLSQQLADSNAKLNPPKPNEQAPVVKEFTDTQTQFFDAIRKSWKLRNNPYA